MANYENVKVELEKQKQELLDRVNKIELDKRSVNNTAAQDVGDIAAAHENDEVIDHLGELDREKILRINDALKRINDNKYGTCEECDTQIEEKRLLAMPYARQCMKCVD